MDVLVVDERLAKGLALAAVFNGLRDTVFQGLDYVGGPPHALLLELQHLHHKAGAFCADAVTLGNSHVVQKHLGGF